MITTAEKRKIADNYLTFLSEGKQGKLLAQFNADSKIKSPIYGEKSAQEFFSELDADTQNSKLTFKGFFDETDSARFALFFNYTWEMANGNTSNFDVVDIFELDKEGKIKSLQIIYNADESATLLNQKKN